MKTPIRRNDTRPFPTASQLPWASPDSFRTNFYVTDFFYSRKRGRFSLLSETFEKRPRLRE